MAEARLRARADMDTKGFDAGMARMRQSVKTFSTSQLKSLAGMAAGAFSVGAITSFARNVAEAGDRIADTAANMRLLPDELQALELAAARSGNSVEGMDTALMKLQKSMNSASTNGKLGEAFEKLGVSSQFLAEHQNDMGAVFEAVSQKVVSSGGDMEVAEAAGQVLGKGYIGLNETMKLVASEGLTGLANGFKATNEIMSNETVAALDKTNSAFEKIGAKWNTWWRKQTVNFVAGAMGIARVLSGSTISEAAQSVKEDLFGDTATKQAVDPEQAKRNAAAIELAKTKAARERQAKIDKIINAPMDNITVGAPVAADAMAKMGLFSGGQVNNAGRMTAERQLKVSEEMAKRLEKVQEIMDKVEKNTANTADNTED